MPPAMPRLTVQELRRLTMPVTVVWGQQEQLFPEKHLDFWSRLPSYRILRPDGAAHSPSYDRPWWFEDLLRDELGLAPRRLLRGVSGRLAVGH